MTRSFGGRDRPCPLCGRAAHVAPSGNVVTHTCPHGQPCPPVLPEMQCKACALARKGTDRS